MVPVWNGCSPSKMRFWAFTNYNIQFFCVDTILTLFCCGHYGHLGSSVLFLVVIFASAFVVYWVIPCHLFSVLWRLVSCWFVLLFVIFFWFSLSCSFVKFLKGLCQGLCPTIVSPQLCSHCLSFVYSFLFFVRSLFWFVSVSHVPLKLVCSDQKTGENTSGKKQQNGIAKYCQKHETVCHPQSVLVRVSQVYCLLSNSWHWSGQLSLACWFSKSHVWRKSSSHGYPSKSYPQFRWSYIQTNPCFVRIGPPMSWRAFLIVIVMPGC